MNIIKYGTTLKGETGVLSVLYMKSQQIEKEGNGAQLKAIIMGLRDDWGGWQLATEMLASMTKNEFLFLRLKLDTCCELLLWSVLTQNLQEISNI